MSGITMEARIDDREIMQALSRLDTRARNMTPAMKAIGEYMIRRTQERFSSEKDPEGKPWKPHAAVTLPMAWRRKGRQTHTAVRKQVSAAFSRYAAGRKILTGETRNLRSIAYDAGPDFVNVGTTPPSKDYAAIQQLGGKAGRGHKVTIPSRIFLGINADDRAEAIRIMKDHMGIRS